MRSLHLVVRPGRLATRLTLERRRMSPRATHIVHRLSADQQTSRRKSDGPTETAVFPTTSGSTRPAIGRPGANTEPAGGAPTRKTPPAPRFVEGKGQTGRIGRIRTSKSEPCPVCGGADCSFSDDRSVLVCWRGDGQSAGNGYRYVRPGSSGGSVYVRGDNDAGIRAALERVGAGTLTGNQFWAARVDDYLEHQEAAARRQALARELGVSDLALAGLSVGWKPATRTRRGAWSYPQRNATGSVVSCGLRYDTPDKGQRQRYDFDGRKDSDPAKVKSTAGLIYIPGRWLTSSGPVLTVEGMSDVAALDTIGLDAVGHPGNRPGPLVLDELEKLLRAVPADRDIVAVAERDPGREDDDNAPGRTGARYKARELANRLRRRVGVALPPDAAKDSRGWLGADVAAGGNVSRLDAATRQGLRERFVSGLLADVEWVEPEQEKPRPPERIERLVEDIVEVELDDYRQAMRERLAAWVEDDRRVGRIGLLAAPAGTGKTTAVDELAVPSYASIVAGVPTHANVAERRDSLLRLPIIDPDDVAAFPKLDEHTCQSYTAEQVDELRRQGHRGAMSAARMQSLGFGVAGTACRGCPLAPSKPSGRLAEADPILAAFTGDEPGEADVAAGGLRCRYWREHGIASAARVKLATLDRVRLSSTSLVEKGTRSLVTIDERGFETLFPGVEVGVADLELLVDALFGAADRIRAQSSGNAPPARTKLSYDPASRQWLTVAAAAKVKTRRRRRSVDEPSLLDTPEDRSRRDERRKLDRQREERDKRKAARASDKVEHIDQLLAIARELVERVHGARTSRTFGSQVVGIVRERSTRKSNRLTPAEDAIVVRATNELARRYSDERPGADLAAGATSRQTTPPPVIVRGRKVKHAGKLLADVLERSLPDDAIISAGALDLVRRIHAGTLDRLVLHVEELDGGETSRVPEADRRVRASVIGTWETRLPPEADVLVLDGTVDAVAFAKRLGRDVDELAPPARIRRQSLAVQLPQDITAETSPVKVAAALEQAVRALPDSRRLGVILLKFHRDRLFPRDRNGNDIRTAWSREFVPDDVLARIARDENGRLLVEHYAGGRDRASNRWIEQADGLILLGTRRPPSVSVVQELARRREDDAIVAGSAWGAVAWEAKTRDGTVVRCRGRGYIDATWAAAARAVTLAGLVQALERARTVLPTADEPGGRPGGIPVLVVSSEPGLGLPVVSELPAAVSRGARRVAETVRKLLDEPTKVVTACEDGQVTGQGRPSCASIMDSIEDRVDPIGRMIEAQHDRLPGVRCEDRQPPGGSVPGSACAKSPIGTVAQARLPDPGGSVTTRRVLDGILAGPGLPSEPTARRWIAEALAAGLVTSTGRTSATRYGLPPPCDIPDALVVEPEPIVVEEPVEVWTEPAGRNRWPSLDASPLVGILAGGPAMSRGATGPPALLPTGPAAA